MAAAQRKLVVVKLEETDFWTALDKPPELGRLFGVYVADLSRRVHCCEMTASYELWFVETEFEGGAGYPHLEDKDQEACQDYVMDGDRHTDGVSYVHCHQVDALSVIDGGLPVGHGCVIDLRTDDANTEDDYATVMEDAASEVMANYV